MATTFDPGYAAAPFAELCREYPGPDVYPPEDFRVEWGPVFHRGRLDGSARILVVGQDPAASEVIARRILVGAAGQRVQGLLARLGVGTRYVLVNTFLYGVYGQSGGERHRHDADMARYRERWFAALLGPGVQAVLALGSLAASAWEDFRRRDARAAAVPFEAVRHPTWPESSAGRDAEKLAANTRALLESWNGAIERLAPILGAAVRKYGTTWRPGDLVAIPPDDLPPGLPAWMRSLTPWAKRAGADAAEKRATLVVTVPSDAMVASRAATGLAAAERARAGDEEDEGQAPVDDGAVERLAAHVHPDARGGLGDLAARALRKYALRGRVVTMVDDAPVKESVVWVSGGRIAAVQDVAPEGFAGIVPVETGAFIYPGFMDLHNHLAYNLLSLWKVPAAYDDRDDWKDEATYDQQVKRPLSILRDTPETLGAICRYAECKALFGGVTTSQGIRLAKASSAPSYFRGIVRNVESPDDGALPRGDSRMSDVDAKDVEAFWAQLERFGARNAAFLLHLSEGCGRAAHAHFEALRRGTAWAIDRALAGIHCVALTADDFRILQRNGGSMIWSPFSNLLLYGRTANVAAARKAKLRIGLGCDWSPSGSKNLLAEMKVAATYRDPGTRRRVFTDRDVVAMVTRTAAEILRWDGQLGEIAPGRIADLTVLRPRATDAYESAVAAREADVRLVVVGGVPRYGHPDLMHALVTPDRDVEDVVVAGEARTIDLESEDPRVPRVAFSRARAILTDALARLPELEGAETGLRALPAALLRTAAPPAGGWRLALDEIEPTGLSFRPLAPAARRGGPVAAGGKRKLPTKPVPLDPPTIADHPGYFDALAGQRNLPDGLAAKLRRLYEDSAPAGRPGRRSGSARRRRPA